MRCEFPMQLAWEGLPTAAAVVVSLCVAVLLFAVQLLRRNASCPLRVDLVTVPLPAPLWKSVFLGHFGEILASPPGSWHLKWAREKRVDIMLYFGHLQVQCRSKAVWGTATGARGVGGRVPVCVHDSCCG